MTGPLSPYAKLPKKPRGRRGPGVRGLVHYLLCRAGIHDEVFGWDVGYMVSVCKRCWVMKEL